MKILFLTQWFDPEPTPKGINYVRKLTELGHEVQVLTGFPNYPTGRIYDGYKLTLVMREIIDGIEVIRVPLYPSHDSSGIKRAINYISFAIFAASIGIICTDRKFDIIHAYHPPATIGLPALLLKWVKHAKLVYDVQDLWPDTLPATGMICNPVIIGALNKWCSLIYQISDMIIVLSPGFKRTLSSRCIPEEKIEVMYNWSAEEDIVYSTSNSTDTSDNIRVDLELQGKFVVLYAGALGLAQGLESVLEAAELLQEETCFHFLFMGDGLEKQRLESFVDRRKINNVSFLPRRQSRDMRAYYKNADALLVHLKDNPLFRITIPSKTQTCLAAGRPIIMAVNGDAADLVEASGAGIVCRSEDPVSIADAVRMIARTSEIERKILGKHGRQYYEKHLSLSVGVNKLISIFEKVRKH